MQSKQERSICFVHSSNKKTHQGNCCFSSYTFSIISNIWHVVGNKLLKVIRIRHKKNRGLEFLLHIFYATRNLQDFCREFRAQVLSDNFGISTNDHHGFSKPYKKLPIVGSVKVLLDLFAVHRSKCSWRLS